MSAAIPAISLWQPWASLVVRGLKAYEFRTWAAPRRFVGKRVAIHAAARKPTRADWAALLDALRAPAGFVAILGREDAGGEALAFVERALRDPALVPLGAVVGTVVLGRPQRCVDLFRTVMDPAEIIPGMWAWPCLEPEAFVVPLPAKGAQGWWEWRPEDPAAAGPGVAGGEAAEGRLL